METVSLLVINAELEDMLVSCKGRDIRWAQWFQLYFQHKKDIIAVIILL